VFLNRDPERHYAEADVELAKDVAGRVPGAAIVVQFDEPLLAAVLLGRVPTASGFGTLRVVEPPTVIERLKVVIDAVVAVGATPIAHCCAASPPVGLFVEAGMRAVSLDATQLSERDDDELGQAIELGVALFLGLVPSLDVEPVPRLGEIVFPARRLWSRLGFAPENLTRDVVVTPTCGLAGSSPAWPRTAYRLCREAATVLLEAPEENS